MAVDQAGAVIQVDQLHRLGLAEQFRVDQKDFQARIDVDEVTLGGKARQRLAHEVTIGSTPAWLVVHQAGQGDQRADIATAIGEGLLEQRDGLRGIGWTAAGQYLTEQARGGQVAALGQQAQVVFHRCLVVLKQRIAHLVEAALGLCRTAQRQGQGACAKDESDRHGDLRMSSAWAGRA